MVEMKIVPGSKVEPESHASLDGVSIASRPDLRIVNLPIKAVVGSQNQPRDVSLAPPVSYLDGAAIDAEPRHAAELKFVSLKGDSKPVANVVGRGPVQLSEADAAMIEAA